MKKKFKKNFFLLGMGKSGISLAKFLSSNGIAYLCWDDNDKKRDYLLQENFNLSTVNLNNLKQCFFLVLSPGINHSSSNPHEAIKIAKKLNIKIITDLELLALLNYKKFSDRNYRYKWKINYNEFCTENYNKFQIMWKLWSSIFRPRNTK